MIHIVDDDASFRRGIARLLRLSGYEVEEHASAVDLLSRIADGADISCVLLDVKMPGLSGPELQDRLVGQNMAAPIVYLTGHGDIPTSVRAIKAGAEDFLTKPVSQETLLSAVRRALERHELELQRQDRLNAWQARLARLTPRERQVFELVVRGKINKQVGHELGTTERTIKAHRHRMMEKMGARSLVDLVAMAERLGILSAQAASDSRMDT
jgi:FixJ family two-component response regulator